MDQVVEKALSGDSAAEEQLFKDLLVRFRYLAALRVGEEDALEIAQQACITVYEKYKTETFTVSFQAWAAGVLKNTVLQSIRKESRRRARELP